MSSGALALKSGLLRHPVYSEIRRATIKSDASCGVVNVLRISAPGLGPPNPGFVPA